MHPIVQRLHALDEALACVGFPRTSPWWLDTLARFYSTACRQLVLRVGRRGGKSSTLCRVAVVEALYGEHVIPPGDVGVCAIISTHRDEAAQRMRTIRAILDALGVKYRPIDGGIELADRPIAFKVYTASISGVSGFTAIAVVADEVSKWRDADTGANPAREVLSSLRPTLATMPSARIFLSSSPLGRLDAHASAFDTGDDWFQLVAFAPTWVANPTVTEAATHKLERDEDRWRREYAAIPMEGDETSLLSATLLDRATRAVAPALAPADLTAGLRAGDVPREPGVTYVAAMDPGFVRNPWTFVVAARRWVAGRIKRSVVLVREWRGTAASPNDPALVLGEIAPLVRYYDTGGVWSDQYEKYGLQSIASRPEIDIGVWVEDKSAAERLARYEAMVTQFSDDEIELPSDKQVRADLLAIRQRLTPNGFTIHLPETPDGRHADYAPSVSLALAQCLADPEPLPPAMGTPAFYALQEALIQQRLLEAAERRHAEATRREDW